MKIKGELYSKKNSKQIYRNHKTKKSFVASNDNVIANEKDIYMQLAEPANKAKWRNMTRDKKFPLAIRFMIYRKTMRAFDYVNIIQVLLDAMVKAGYLPDDDMNHLTPIFEGWEKDVENPRVEFWV